MSARARITLYWLLFAATMGVYATMISWTLPAIARDAGAPAFDMRPGGYTAEAARGFLAALGPEGRAIYQGPQKLLDLAYPALLAVWLIWSLGWAGRGRWPWLVIVPVLAAVLGAGADYVENISVGYMLAEPDPAQVSGQLIAQANLATRIKSTLTTVAMLVLLILTGLRLLRPPRMV